MAVFPCDWSGHRYPSRQLSVYITSVWQQDAETARLRLCSKHNQELKEICASRMSLVDEDSQFSKFCEVCQGDRIGCLFVKFFSEKGDISQYCVDLCATHWQAYRDQVHVASGRPMAAP